MAITTVARVRMLRMECWWILSILYVLACQVVNAADSDLCCYVPSCTYDVIRALLMWFLKSVFGQGIAELTPAEK